MLLVAAAGGRLAPALLRSRFGSGAAALAALRALPATPLPLPPPLRRGAASSAAAGPSPAASAASSSSSSAAASAAGAGAGAASPGDASSASSSGETEEQRRQRELLEEEEAILGGGRSSSSSSSAEGGGGGEDEERAYDANEPFVSRASRAIWGSVKLAAGVGFFGLLCYAGYTVVTTLLPVGASSNAIKRKAEEAVKHDPEVAEYFGAGMRTYGVDPGGRAEGRRYFVPEYKYEDPLTGERFVRIKFTLEGERPGRKAWVYAEVAQSTHEFRYLIVQVQGQPRGGRAPRHFVVVDRRAPPLRAEVRQGRVAALLAGAGWAFFAHSRGDAEEQAEALGEGWAKVACVRCDQEPDRCRAAGVEPGVGSASAWADPKAAQAGALLPRLPWAPPRGELAKGVQSLDALERMVLPLVRAEAGGFLARLGLA